MCSPSMAYKVKKKAPISEGKAIDLVATKGNERIAMETRKSDVEANVGKCKHAGLEKAMVVNAHKQKKSPRDLARHCLMNQSLSLLPSFSAQRRTFSGLRLSLRVNPRIFIRPPKASAATGFTWRYFAKGFRMYFQSVFLAQ